MAGPIISITGPIYFVPHPHLSTQYSSESLWDMVPGKSYVTILGTEDISKVTSQSEN